MIARLFDRINQLGTTVILATHDESILSSFRHRKILLEKGKLMKDSGGKPAPAAKLDQVETVKTEKMDPRVKPEDDNKPSNQTEKKVEKNTEIKKEDKPEIKSETKKPFFKLPKFSLHFGRKKKVEEITTKAATTETNQKETEKQKTEEPVIKLKKPIIEQENLDGAMDPRVKPEDDRRKKSASPQPVVEVETLQAMIKEKK